ncbi:MAG: flagellar biosynthesis protein FlhB [Syntrophobacterales bacterium]|nr:flagellar biosynthesis protein FlhB [Syntrophobacterales bacterium]
MASGSQERTEKPTPKRIQKARAEGRLDKSREIVNLASLVGGAIGLWIGIVIIYHSTKVMMETLWSNGFSVALKDDISHFVLITVVKHFGLMVAPSMFFSLVFAFAANYYQNKGLIFVWKNLFKFDLSQIDFINGFKRLFSLRSFVELLKSFIKFGAVSYALYSVFCAEYHLFLPTVMEEPIEIARTVGDASVLMFTRVILVMLVLSYFDMRYQKWQYTKDLMMTKQEVKEEHRQAEGDPKIKARIRSKQMELARRRMLAQVPKSTVVVTNPTHFAVALLYKPGKMEAPKVVAKGIDHMALKIIKIARHYGVPIVYNPPLARALYKYVPLESFIPVALYKAVAKVIAYVYQQKKKRL